MDIFIVKYDSVTGQLYTLLTRLNQSGINILGTSSVICDGKVLRNLVTNDDNKTMTVLTAFNYDFQRVASHQAKVEMTADLFSDWLPQTDNNIIISPLLCIPINDSGGSFVGVVVADDRIEDTWNILRRELPTDVFDTATHPLIIAHLPIANDLSEVFKCIEQDTMFRIIGISKCDTYREIRLVPHLEDDDSFSRLVNQISNCGIEGIEVFPKYLLKAMTTRNGDIAVVAQILAANQIGIQQIIRVPGEPAASRVFYALVSRN